MILEPFVHDCHVNWMKHFSTDASQMVFSAIFILVHNIACVLSIRHDDPNKKFTKRNTFFFVEYGQITWWYDAAKKNRLANQLLSPIRYTYRMLTDLLALWLCLFRSFQRPAMFDVLIYVFDLLNGRFMRRKVHDSKWFRWEY